MSENRQLEAYRQNLKYERNVEQTGEIHDWYNMDYDLQETYVLDYLNDRFRYETFENGEMDAATDCVSSCLFRKSFGNKPSECCSSCQFYEYRHNEAT